MESYLGLLVLITPLAIIHIVQAQDQQGSLFFSIYIISTFSTSHFLLDEFFYKGFGSQKCTVFLWLNLLPCLLTLSRIH